FSLNIPVAGEVKQETNQFTPYLTDFEVRDHFTFVIKRFQEDRDRIDQIQKRTRHALSGMSPFSVKITGIDCFRNPPKGDGTVVYFAVESSQLLDIHKQLCDEFGIVQPLEGDEYSPHITIARGNNEKTIETLLSQSIKPITWQVNHLEFFDPVKQELLGQVGLPI
ncbi:MAG: 2'-5' RNA ligase family protein, partial [Halobacteriaceae archaeon]